MYADVLDNVVNFSEAGAEYVLVVMFAYLEY